MLRIRPTGWDLSLTRAINPHETGTSVCHGGNPGLRQGSEGTGASRSRGTSRCCLARAPPKAPQMSDHVFPPNICLQFPSLTEQGCAGGLPALRGQPGCTPPTRAGGSGFGFEVRWDLGNRCWEGGEGKCSNEKKAEQLPGGGSSCAGRGTGRGSAHRGWQWRAEPTLVAHLLSREVCLSCPLMSLASLAPHRC